MGLAENLKAYASKGGDPQKVIDRLVASGDLPDKVKWNSKARRKLERHPEKFTQGQISEAFHDDSSKVTFLISLRRRRMGLDPEQAREDEEYEDDEEEEDDEDDDEEEDENE